MNKLFEVYSKGLFRSLNRADVPEVIELFQSYTKSNTRSLSSFFKNKTISKDKKLSFAIDLFGSSEELTSFIKTIDANNRYELFPGIFEYFVTYAQKELNNIPVRVFVNKKPNEEVQNKVNVFVREHIGTETPVSYEINDNVLGGIILKYKDREIDLSINNKINGLQTTLIN